MISGVWFSEEAEAQHVGRRAQAGVDAVELDPGGPAADQAEIADDLVGHALEDEGGARIVGVGRAAIVGGEVEALGDEADAADHIRRPADRGARARHTRR